MYEDSHLEMEYEDRHGSGSAEARDEMDEFFEPYCDYCENEGHNYLHCPRRDDEHE